MTPPWLVSAVLRRLYADDGKTTIRECRHCGTGVDADVDSCPTCGTTEIAVYELA